MNQAKLNTLPVVLARQPIFDRKHQVYAYELLFRGARNHSNADLSKVSPELATSRVINYAFLELGIERVIGQHIAFINLTRPFILNDEPIPAGQSKVVLEVLEGMQVDEELLDGIKRLKAKGYTIALDDFIYHESLRPLMELADVIKVDVLTLDSQQLSEHAEILQKYDVKLLAEKVETKTDYELCHQLGFDYFQGFFFCRPDIIEDQPIPDNQFLLLQLIQKLQDPDVELRDIEALISKDAGLSFKLLRLLNSAAVGLSRQINSIREGLVILGLKTIRTWTTLIAMSELNSVPQELLDYALIRAKMCESLAEHYDCSAESGFLVGLFSTIDAMLNRPMKELVKSLPLSTQTKLALLERQGPLGALLNDVILCEQGGWEAVDETQVSLEQFSQIYIDAAEWALTTRESI